MSLPLPLIVIAGVVVAAAAFLSSGGGSGGRKARIIPAPLDRRLAQMPYGDRRFITITDDVRTSSDSPRGDGEVVALGLPSSHIESQGIRFPPSHPQTGLLYVSHPCTGTLYYPAFDVHRAVVEQKFAELLTLLESLGATRIYVRAREEWSRCFGAGATLNLPDNLAWTVQGRGRASEKGIDELIFSATGRGLRGRPKIPSDLHWLEKENIWKALATAELNRWPRTEPSSVAWSLKYEEDCELDANLDASLWNGLSIGLGGTVRKSRKISWDVEAEFPEAKPVAHLLASLRRTHLALFCRGGRRSG